VLAGHGIRPQAAVVSFDQLLANEQAGGVPRFGGLGEGYPSPDEQRFDRAD
jgi:hypothetical protein